MEVVEKGRRDVVVQIKLPEEMREKTNILKLLITHFTHSNINHIMAPVYKKNWNLREDR